MHLNFRFGLRTIIAEIGNIDALQFIQAWNGARLKRRFFCYRHPPNVFCDRAVTTAHWCDRATHPPIRLMARTFWVRIVDCQEYLIA